MNDDSPASRATFEDRQSDSIVGSRGRALIEDYWGNYVAILPDERAQSVTILKDPAGSLPCFVTTWRGVRIVFSHLQDCMDLGLLPFTVNWAYVTARVASCGADVSHNSLNEVSQVRRGECLEINQIGEASGTRRLYWQPVRFADLDNVIDNVDVAARALRACVRSASHSLAAGHSNILMRLSGGLDSSIVAGCLKDVAPGAGKTAYTYFVAGGKSDERRWARMAAQHAGFSHIERAYDPASTSLESALQLAACVEPSQVVGTLVRGAMEASLAQSCDFSAVFSGDGGDSTFAAEAIRHVVDDFLRIRGISAFALTLASQVALRTDTLTWRVLSEALLRMMRGSKMSDFRHRFLNKQTLAAKHVESIGLKTPYFPHHWFCGMENVPWHVIRRVGALILTPEFYDPLRDSNESAPIDIAPLYSQPVVELSLRIPLYVHFDHGIERGLARKAFASDAPKLVLRRLWKDRAPDAFEALAHRNCAFLRETILDGFLARAGLIDSPTIENILRGDFSKGDYFIGELFALLDLELWIRHFESRTSLAASA